MKQLQEFVESFINAKRSLDHVNREQMESLFENFCTEGYAERFKSWCAAKESQPEKIIRVDIAGESASVFTVELLGKTEQRYQYRLKIFGGRWKICGKLWQCFACGGTGGKMNQVCSFCNGVGWGDNDSNKQ